MRKDAFVFQRKMRAGVKVIPKSEWRPIAGALKQDDARKRRGGQGQLADDRWISQLQGERLLKSSTDIPTCPNCETNDVVLTSSQGRVVGGQYVGEHQDWRCTRCGHTWPDWRPGDMDPASLANLRDPRVARWPWMVITAFFALAIWAIAGIVRRLM